MGKRCGGGTGEDTREGNASDGDVHQVAAGHGQGLPGGYHASSHPTPASYWISEGSTEGPLGRQPRGPPRMGVRPHRPGRWLGVKVQGQAWLSWVCVCLCVCVHVSECVCARVSVSVRTQISFHGTF